MTERRPFPPSARRLALARRAGLTSASPVLVGASACTAAVLAAVVLARAVAAKLGGWVVTACAAAGDASAIERAFAGTAAERMGSAFGSDSTPLATGAASNGSLPAPGGVSSDTLLTPGSASSEALLAPGSLATTTLEIALPLLGAIALVAFVAHVAQTRALWLPRRRIVGAPVLEPARVRREALDTASAVVIGLVAFGWLWVTAPRLAGLFALEPTFDRMLVAVGAAVASFIAALAIAWLALGVLDALVRRVELSRALAMTVTEKREDDRIAAADPRWRAQRLALARGPRASDAVARAAVLVLGDDIAVAIAWDARRQPVPLRTITARAARSTQLLGLARRHHVPVHRDPRLAAALVDGEGPVPDAHWAHLAEIIAAVQRPNTGRDLST